MTVLLPTARTLPHGRTRGAGALGCCARCGTSTGFEVIRSSKAVERTHRHRAREPRVAERAGVNETIDSVRCRWCSATDQVERVDRPGAGS